MIRAFRSVSAGRGMPDSLREISLESVRRALALPGFDAPAAQLRMAPYPRPERPSERPGSPRLAAVLVLLYPVGEALHFVLTRRTEYPGVHSGQISLPGGKREGEEAFSRTALRETEEEIGVVCDSVELLGELTPLYVPPSDYLIHPRVGACTARPTFRPDPSEVAEIIEAPLGVILDDSIKGTESVTRYERPFTIAYYHIGGHKVWGATAIMLSELEWRLRAALAEQP